MDTPPKHIQTHRENSVHVLWQNHMIYGSNLKSTARVFEFIPENGLWKVFVKIETELLSSCAAPVSDMSFSVFQPFVLVSHVSRSLLISVISSIMLLKSFEYHRTTVPAQHHMPHRTSLLNFVEHSSARKLSVYFSSWWRPKRSQTGEWGGKKHFSKPGLLYLLYVNKGWEINTAISTSKLMVGQCFLYQLVSVAPEWPKELMWLRDNNPSTTMSPGQTWTLCWISHSLSPLSISNKFIKDYVLLFY